MPLNDEEQEVVSISLLAYRVKKLEEMLEPLLKLVNSLETKIALLTQKILILTAGIGVVFNGIGIWYNTHGGKEYSEPEKKVYYEGRINESDKIKELQAEIERLKKSGAR